MITTLSFLSGLLAVYLFYKNHYILSAFFFILGYFFDCIDGNMARQFNMITKFGDLYDHLTDIFVSVALLIVFIIKNIPIKLKIFSLTIILFFLFLGCIHLGCQEKYYELINKKVSNDGVLSKFRNMCKDKTYIYITKYFGLGTYTVVIVLLILFIKPLSKLFC
jgi:phosphatidylglycerophosphate synthase